MSSRGQVVTFYSYKGGVGRSFLVASVAAALASWGKRVICIDWDLEAPGLSQYFSPYSKPIVRGLLDLTEDLRYEHDGSWRRYVTRVRFSNGAELDFISAGSKQDYSDRVQALSWDELFDRYKFGEYLESMRRELKRQYDFILIDSRTGISDIGGICAVQLPDILLVLVSTSNQSVNGTAEIAERIPAARDSLAFDRLALPIIPILSRFDAREERELGQKWLDRIARRLGFLCEAWLPVGHRPIDILERTTIPYISAWNFGERIPVLEERSSSPESVNWSIDNISALIINGLSDISDLISDRDSFVRRARTQSAASAISYDVFISAARHDITKARGIAKNLSNDGFLVFTDDSIPEGGARADRVQIAIQASSHLLLITDGKLSKSQDVELESFVAASVRRGIESRVIVVLARGQSQDLSRGLRQFQQIDWTTATRTAAEVETALSLRGQANVLEWQSVLAERELNLVSDHPAVLATRANLARAYLESGRTEEAIELLQPTLAAQLRELGPDDPAVLATRANLARAYLESGRTEEAIELDTTISSARFRAVLRQLNATDPAVRRAAVEALGAYREPSVSDSLLRSLDDEDATVRHAAVQALGARREPGLTAFVLGSLKDPDSAVRMAAVQALGARWEPGVTEALLRMLEDPDPAVRHAAVQALGTREEPGVTEALLVRSSRDVDSAVRRVAVQALGARPEPVVTETLLRMLEDPDSAVRRAAVQALGTREEPGVTEALLQSLSDPAVRGAAVQALGAQHGDPEFLSRFLNDVDPAVRRAAVQALGARREPWVIEALLRSLEDPGSAVRRAAVQALGARQEPALTEFLLPLLEDSVPAVRRAAVQALGARQEPALTEFLLPLLEDSDPAVRRAAVQALGARQEPALTEFLLPLLEDSDPAVRRTAINLMASRQGPYVTEALLQSLDDADPAVQQAAVQALAKQQDLARP
jgi:HEAT repeat protein/MinD-like ATPase involved in chromosome partitioning or flagellar assembly